MSDNVLALKKLRDKRWKYEDRCKWLVALLVLQFLIWWIQNPGFIPGISQWVMEIQKFFDDLLWPHDLAELETGSYRVYIYHIWTWIEELPIYPMLEIVIPRILPVWLIITIIQIVVVKIRIKNLKKPPKEPKKAKEAKPDKASSKNTNMLSGPMVSGVNENHCKEANKRLKALQDSCVNPFREDRGLWVSNIAPGANGKAPYDKIYSWNDFGVITLKFKETTFRFELYNNGARLITHTGEWVNLKKGVPLAICHQNEAGQQILDMTVTWLGGIVK